MTLIESRLQTLLNEKKEQANWRELKNTGSVRPQEIILNGNKLINFASNDYLGLSQHPLLKERAIKAIEKYGVGNPSSRLIAGNCELYEQIELTLAHLKGTEAALIFPTGFQTNVTVLNALSKLDSFFFCDKLCHNSILLGLQINKRQSVRFAHNDLLDLQRLLLEKQKTNTIVVTESVFSMDGDLAPVDDLLALTSKLNIHLYIDEAHATGVFGKNGMGLVNNPTAKTIIMGTFSKGGGSLGAYIACSEEIKNYLVNYCAGIIYSTALPPPVLASIQAALDLIPDMDIQRKTLLQQSAFLREELLKIGFNLGSSNSHIISLLIGDNKSALSLSRHLENNKIYAPAIRPPTVPENTARIRLSLTALHSNLDIEHLLTVLKEWYVSQH